MGRKNRRAPSPPPREPGNLSAQEHPDGDWYVRRIAGFAAVKAYICPGCNQQLLPGTAHVVVWSAQQFNGAEHRRHWHTPCWDNRARRHSR